MSKKPFKSTGILLGVLVLLGLTVYFFGSDAAHQRSRQNEFSQSYLNKSIINSADSLVFVSSEENLLSLQKQDGEWTLSSQKLDELAQEDLKTALIELPKGKLISKNADSWTEYGLDESAMRVELYDGEDPLSVLRFGNPSRGAGSFYMRRDDDPSVYAVDTALYQFLQYDETRWLSKKLIRGSLEDLSQFSVRVGETKHSFVLESDTWKQVTDQGSVSIDDQVAVKTYLETLFGLQATGFESDLSLFGVSDEALSLVFEDLSEYTLSVDVQDEAVTYAQVTDGVQLFTLAGSLESHLRPSFLDVEESPEEDPVEE